MKNTKTELILIVMVLLWSCTMLAQEFKETISKELSFENYTEGNWFTLQNVNGYVQIEGYEGKTIKMEIEKIITAKTEEALQRGIHEINVAFVNKTKHIYAHLDSPWTDFKLSSGRFNYNEDWKGNENERYGYILNFKVKVPANINVKATTINRGDVSIKDIFGDNIVANNINGGISLDNVSGQTSVNALNKDINIKYRSNPNRRSKFHTLNGNIDITFQKNLNADITFKSLNGAMYTNFELTKSNQKMNGKGKKRRHRGEFFKIGKGGAKLDFHVLNGNVYLRY